MRLHGSAPGILRMRMIGDTRRGRTAARQRSVNMPPVLRHLRIRQACNQPPGVRRVSGVGADQLQQRRIAPQPLRPIRAPVRLPEIGERWRPAVEETPGRTTPIAARKQRRSSRVRIRAGVDSNSTGSSVGTSSSSSGSTSSADEPRQTASHNRVGAATSAAQTTTTQRARIASVSFAARRSMANAVSLTEMTTPLLAPYRQS